MKFINATQSKEERRFKYLLCRVIGLQHHNARRFRDCSLGHIALQCQRIVNQSRLE